MDIRVCAVCKKEFDFDTGGLESPSAIVCGTDCAIVSAGSRGKKYAIHDESDAIVKTNSETCNECPNRGNCKKV